MFILHYFLSTGSLTISGRNSNHFRVFRKVEFSDSKKIAKNISENEIRHREIRLVGGNHDS